jgi:hypothetical protein
MYENMGLFAGYSALHSSEAQSRLDDERRRPCAEREQQERRLGGRLANLWPSFASIFVWRWTSALRRTRA